PDDGDMANRDVQPDQLVRPADPNAFIHIAPDELEHLIAEQVRGLVAMLTDLGVNVSTGRVVDFRARHLLRAQPGEDTAPLIYPGHFSHGLISWPNLKIRKPNALALKPDADDLLVPADFYVL